MVWPLLGFAATLISAGAQAQAGREQERAAQLEAKAQIASMEMARAAGKSRIVAMTDQYQQSVASNEAFFAFAGRDIGMDRSVKAFLDKQEETHLKNVSAAARNIETESTSRRLEAELTKMRGTNARRAAGASAFTTLLGGASNLYKTYYTPDG